MPEGSGVGGFPVMEPAEQSITWREMEGDGGGWRVGGGKNGLGQRRGMRKQGRGNGHQMKWRCREKYGCVELPLAVINRPGLSYSSDISRRQSKSTQSRVLPDPPGSPPA